MIHLFIYIETRYVAKLRQLICFKVKISLGRGGQVPPPSNPSKMLAPPGPMVQFEPCSAVLSLPRALELHQIERPPSRGVTHAQNISFFFFYCFGGEIIFFPG